MFERVCRFTIIGFVLAWPLPYQIASAQITPELIEAAKKEGEVMFYGAITINSSKAVGDAFENSTVSICTIGAATPPN